MCVCISAQLNGYGIFAVCLPLLLPGCLNDINEYFVCPFCALVTLAILSELYHVHKYFISLKHVTEESLSICLL